MLRTIGKQYREYMESVVMKKRKGLSLEWKNEGVMDDENGELMEPTEEVPLEELGESELERLVWSVKHYILTNVNFTYVFIHINCRYANTVNELQQHLPSGHGELCRAASTRHVSALPSPKLCYTVSYSTTHTRARLTALLSGLPRWASTWKVKPIWILLK